MLKPKRRSKKRRLRRKPKTTPKPLPKTSVMTAKAKPTPTPKPAPKKQIIVNVTSARVRNDKNLQSDTLQFADIGTTFTVLEETGEWSKVKLADDREGWISKTIVENFSPANKTKIYNSIADKYLANKKLDFVTAANVYYFLKKTGDETDSAELEFKGFTMLEKVLKLNSVRQIKRKSV